MSRKVLNRPKKLRGQFVEILGQRLNQRAILSAIGRVKIRDGRFDKGFEEHGRAVSKGMGAASGRFDPGNFNRERAKKWTRNGEGVNGGSQIVTETGQCRFSGGTCSADLPIAF